MAGQLTHWNHALHFLTLTFLLEFFRFILDLLLEVLQKGLELANDFDFVLAVAEQIADHFLLIQLHQRLDSFADVRSLSVTLPSALFGHIWLDLELGKCSGLRTMLFLVDLVGAEDLEHLQHENFLDMHEIHQAKICQDLVCFCSGCFENL